MSSTRFLVLTTLAAAVAAALPAMAQEANGLDRRPARVAQAQAGRALAVAERANAPETAVGRYLRGRGRSDAVLASLRASAPVKANAGGVTHLRMQQEVDGLPVHGAYLKAAVNARGELVHVVDRLVDVSTPAASRIDAQAAVDAAVARLHPDQGGAYFHEAPSATAVVIPMSDGSLARGWLVETWTAKTNQLDHTLIGGDGRILDIERRSAKDSYNVYPNVSPLGGPQTVVAGPAPGAAQPSPLGWLGSGAQLTTRISGNNVDAYLDTDANNQPDKGGSAVATGAFLTGANLAQAPSTTGNKAVSVQNLFYLNNVMHDILYRYGFVEAAGNFQADNLGKGGKDRDPVQAEAQDGESTDNANFATPADGRSPRMQMYLFTGLGATHQVRVTAPTSASYQAMGAGYGGTLTTTGLSGGIVAAVPGDGCTAITTPLSGKIALIDRGTCEFSTKSLNAQKAGAIAAIIADNRVEPIFALAAGADAKKVKIPTLMVGQADGAALKAIASPVATLSQLPVQPLQIDGALDSDVVFHEYCHGLTWRMIGGMDGPLAGAIGEGMSDGCALMINDNDIMGEYASSSPSGIRRFRYAGYPLTYANVTGAEVHDDGEIYAAIVWRMKELFDTAYGAATGTPTLFRYVVDGMNYTPATPAYENMRDGILASVANSGGANAATDACRVWNAFAQFGVGVGAQGVVTGATTVQITPSTVLPAGCTP